MASWSCWVGRWRCGCSASQGLAPLACKTDKIDAYVLAQFSCRDLVPRKDLSLCQHLLVIRTAAATRPMAATGDGRVAPRPESEGGGDPRWPRGATAPC